MTHYWDCLKHALKIPTYSTVKSIVQGEMHTIFAPTTPTQQEIIEITSPILVQPIQPTIIFLPTNQL
jgi:hypothetical protein